MILRIRSIHDMAEADLKPEAPGNRKTRQENFNFYTFKKIKKSRYIDATFRRILTFDVRFWLHVPRSCFEKDTKKGREWMAKAAAQGNIKWIKNNTP